MHSCQSGFPILGCAGRLVGDVASRPYWQNAVSFILESDPNLGVPSPNASAGGLFD